MSSPWYLLGIAGVSKTGKISALKKLTIYYRNFQILGVTSCFSPDTDNPQVQNVTLSHVTIKLDRKIVIQWLTRKTQSIFYQIVITAS